MHYLLNCTNTKIETQRKEFINDIKNVQPQFSHFEHINIIKYCLNMADSLIFNPNFINNILNTYKEVEQNISNDNFNNKSCDNVIYLVYICGFASFSHRNKGETLT